jgi:membrane protease subunit HflC
MLTRISADLQKHSYGITAKFLGIKKLGLPESVTKLVFERMQSERQVLVSQIESEGERQASEIRTAANAESAKMLVDADAAATRIQTEGTRASLNSFEVFKENPALATFLLKLKALEALLKENTTLVLDQSTPPLELLVPATPPKNN